ncbi:MAG TPA: hypothetical protein VMB24_03325 [Dehalococcoidales bacterium]|nr:hypothetical protein [Dehalococcoidales bacterium]
MPKENTPAPRPKKLNVFGHIRVKKSRDCAALFSGGRIKGNLLKGML